MRVLCHNFSERYRFPGLFASSSARHCCWHRNFQLATRIFHYLLEFFICYTSQPSRTVELRFFDSPLFAFLFASTLLTGLSKSLATESLVWVSFGFLSVSSRTRYTFRWCLIQYREPCKTGPRSSNLQFVFSSNTSREVCVVLVTSIYFIGIGNDASRGTYSLTLGSR